VALPADRGRPAARELVPPKPIRELRQLTRYRKAQIAERQREANRLHKALEDTGIKLDCVAIYILGVSGRAMLDALINGTTDPVVLADLAKGRMRAKIRLCSDIPADGDQRVHQHGIHVHLGGSHSVRSMHQSGADPS
jgi:hypothetical protein